VRLLKIKYIDTSGKKKPSDNYAFVLEPVDQMARRLNGAEFDQKGLRYNIIDRKSLTMFGLFQLMVGNTDFSIRGMHNVKIVRLSNRNYPNPIAVPYDFDYCGIINATYAIPNELLPIENVRQRYYMGPCREMFEFEEAFEIFRKKRKQIESLFADSEYLEKSGKVGPLKYIEEFYRIINSKSNVKSVIVQDCRQ
jgi:hypothetical protein